MIDLAKIYPSREDDVHKGDFGRLLVIAGSKKYTGTPIFNAMAALRSGCDLVTIASPERAALVAANYCPDFITVSLPGDSLSPQHVEEIMATIEQDRITAVVFGGGLGRTDRIYDVIQSLLFSIDLPMVLDAEALRCIGKRNIFFDGKHKTIMTPHANELEDLIQGKVPMHVEDVKYLLLDAARRYQSIIVLKGPVDLISDGQTTIENRTGSPFMTKGGFGDTLAGIAGGLLARHVEPFLAAQAAAFINGKAGELAAESKGESLVASDIFEAIPYVLGLRDKE